MDDLRFECPHCKQHLEAPADMAALEITCPTCRRTVTIPSPPVGNRRGGDNKITRQADSTHPLVKFLVFMLLLPFRVLYYIWIWPIRQGISVAKSRGVSPHWMWLGFHPITAWATYVCIRCGVKKTLAVTVGVLALLAVIGNLPPVRRWAEAQEAERRRELAELNRFADTFATSLASSTQQHTSSAPSRGSLGKALGDRKLICAVFDPSTRALSFDNGSRQELPFPFWQRAQNMQAATFLVVQQYEQHETRVGVFDVRSGTLLAIQSIPWNQETTQRSEWVLPGPGSGVVYVDKKTLFGGVNYHYDVKYHYPKEEIRVFVATAITR